MSTAAKHEHKQQQYSSSYSLIFVKTIKNTKTKKIKSKKYASRRSLNIFHLHL